MFYFESCQWKKSTLRVIRVCFHADRETPWINGYVPTVMNGLFVCWVAWTVVLDWVKIESQSCLDWIGERLLRICFTFQWEKDSDMKFVKNLHRQFSKLCKNHISRDSLNRKYYICWPFRSQKRMNDKKTSKGVGPDRSFRVFSNGHKDCNEFRTWIVRIVVSVSKVTSPLECLCCCHWLVL